MLQNLLAYKCTLCMRAKLLMRYKPPSYITTRHEYQPKKPDIFLFDLFVHWWVPLTNFLHEDLMLG